MKKNSLLKRMERAKIEGDRSRYKALRTEFDALLPGQKHLDEYTKIPIKRAESYLKQKRKIEEKERELIFKRLIAQAVMKGKIRRKPLGEGANYRVFSVMGLYGGKGVVVKVKEDKREINWRKKMPFTEVVEEAKEAAKSHKALENNFGEIVPRLYGVQMMLPKESKSGGRKALMGPREVYVFERVEPLTKMIFERKHDIIYFKGVEFPKYRELKKLAPKMVRDLRKMAEKGFSIDANLLNFGIRKKDGRVVYLDTLHTVHEQKAFSNALRQLLHDIKSHYSEEQYLRIRRDVFNEVEKMIKEEKNEKKKRWLRQEYLRTLKLIGVKNEKH
ncbi:hypothetical protein DRN74_01195 [Candidatus Micrarchaeota archaeon]|nr:MAG: hypothetical protein DRN74_01195 [Candidatus Micrarchaeota archaeon]